MEKNEMAGLLIFASVAVVGAILLMTGGLNISDENTGLATKQYISQPTLEKVQASRNANCMKNCEYQKNACDAKAYNTYLACSGNYNARNCQSNWDKAKLACANTYYPCASGCGRYLQ